MDKGRLEAFSDGVIAILITIMVLELKIPHGQEWADLKPLFPVALTYLLSFIYLGIYWNNHHHLFCLVERISGGVLWANLHLLFWLSLVPFATGWMGEHDCGPKPTALYGGVLLMAAIAWTIMQTVILRVQGPGSRLSAALGSDVKGKISIVLYLAGIGLAFVLQWAAVAIYALVALIWIVPDKRIEALLFDGE